MEASQVFSNQRGRLPKQDAIGLADFILSHERQNLPVNIIFSDDAYLETLNSRFRGYTQSTDVLSFPGDTDMGILGEVYISVETARRQAAEYDVTLRNEILRLVCHGVLHLCGYDHHVRTDAVAMRRKEERYLNGMLSRG